MPYLCFFWPLLSWCPPLQSFVAEAMLIMVTVLHLGKCSLPKKPITDDDVDRISLCLKVLSECSPLMNDIFNKECRRSLSHMLAVRLEEEKLSQKVMKVDLKLTNLVTQKMSKFLVPNLIRNLWYVYKPTFVFKSLHPDRSKEECSNITPLDDHLNLMCIHIRLLGLMENFFFIVHQFLLTAALSLSFQFLLVLHNNICFYSLSVEQLFLMSFL